MAHKWLTGFVVVLAQAGLADWVEEPNANSPCAGRYVRLADNDELVNQDNNIRVSADSSEFSQKGSSLLKGDVHVSQNDMQMTADNAELMRDDSGQVYKIEAEGDLKFAAPTFLIAAHSASLDTTTDISEFEQTEYRYYPWGARGTADHLTVMPDKQLVMKNGMYTTCPPTSEFWKLKADEVTLNPNTGRGYAKGATLYMGKVPVFYTPVFSFPIDDQRHTGFLFPDFANLGKSGFMFSVPYYWNISPNKDATLTPRLFTKRGLDMQVNYRYLTKHSNGEVFASWLPNDREYGRFRQTARASSTLASNDPRVRSLNHGNHRSAIHWEHSYQYDEYVNLSWSFEDVADDNHFVDLGNTVKASSDTQLEKVARLKYLSNHWSSQLRYQEFKVLHPFNGPKNSEPYRRHPEWGFAGYYPYVYDWLTIGVKGQMVNFSHKEDPFDRTQFTRGHRYHVRPSVAVPLRFGAMDLTPRVQFDYTHYNLALGNIERERGDASDFTRTVPMYDVDMKMHFHKAGTTSWDFTPHFYYLNVPKREQNRLPNFDAGVHSFSAAELYRDNRFSGIDRVGDEDRLTIGGHLEATRGTRTLFGATFARARLFSPHSTFLCSTTNPQACERLEDTFGGYAWSPYALDMFGRPSEHDKVYANFEWHPESKVQKSMLMFQHNHGDWLFNTGYHFQKIDNAETDYALLTTRRLHQVSGSVMVPINHQWRTFAHTRYDIQHNHNSDLIGGIEYDSCCASVQLYASRYIEGDVDQPNTYKKGVFLSVNFKGLSELAYTGESRDLPAVITGYKPRSGRIVASS